jgi:hypothetical protein
MLKVISELFLSQFGYLAITIAKKGYEKKS